MKAPIEIIPAVLPKSWDDLEAHVARIPGITRHVQIDVVDGHFAKGKTWPYKDGEKFAMVVQQEHGLPHWEELDFEFDLMIADPAAEVMKYVHAGASRIIIHAASKTALPALQQLIDLNEDTGAWSVQVGLAVGCQQNLDDLEPFEGQYDFVQVMGIEHIGKQGEPLSQKALFMLERLRHRYPNLPLQVDGGVKPENAAALVAAGATRLVAGSAIFGSDDARAAYQALYTVANAQ